MMKTNLILATDSYKLTHWRQYPDDLNGVYSYFESRPGAAFPYTVFFGLQSILKRYMVGNVVQWSDISEANALSAAHFGPGNRLFNYNGWADLMTKHGGRLPLRIKAVPEGTCVPVSNVLMTVENTDPEFPWLTNAMESLLTHVWYPSTVATLSHATLAMIRRYVQETGGDVEAVKFMLHDFGYRGASSHESAAIGGAAHLVNGVGTDTLPALQLALADYAADAATLGFSVPATEHSVMTAEGEAGEFDVVDRLLEKFPTGILSVVADSYNIYRFVETMGTRRFRDRIMTRDGVFVIRPDSVTEHDTSPERLMVNLLVRAWELFDGTMNDKGFKVINPRVRFLWGDGIDKVGIDAILSEMAHAGFAAENIATFGMGGGLLQKVNRDTQRFAFKAAAVKRSRGWEPVSKTTFGKQSKAGKLHLIRTADGGFETVSVPNGLPDELVTVFENGELVREWSFDQVRARAAAGIPEGVLV
jgi:nicotinamide phosphoribosyltransferase